MTCSNSNRKANQQPTFRPNGGGYDIKDPGGPSFINAFDFAGMTDGLPMPCASAASNAGCDWFLDALRYRLTELLREWSSPEVTYLIQARGKRTDPNVKFTLP